MKDIIEQEGKFWRECSLVMLTTDKYEGCAFVFNTPNNKLMSFNGIKDYGSYKTIKGEDFFEEWDKVMLPQHLYILSDEEIKKDEWFINELNQLWQHNGKIEPYKGSKKIIATTNTELTSLQEDNIFGGTMVQCLPQIPQSFIQEFIKANGKEYEKVLVEVNNFSELSGKYPDIYKLKLSSDNAVNIKANVIDNWKEIFEIINNPSASIGTKEAMIRERFNSPTRKIN